MLFEKFSIIYSFSFCSIPYLTKCFVARAQLLSGRLPGTYLVRMGEQPRVYFLSYLDAESRLQHVAIDRLPDNAQGFQPRAHPAHPVDLPPFVDWTEYVFFFS